MSKLQILLFCAATLAGSAGIAAALFPYAALPEQTLAVARTPQPMERFGSVDLGPQFGSLPVVDLLGYYLENPPRSAPGGGAPAPRPRFSGC